MERWIILDGDRVKQWYTINEFIYTLNEGPGSVPAWFDLGESPEVLTGSNAGNEVYQLGGSNWSIGTMDSSEH